ncbi:C6 zinc finger protein [Colletotrichum orchidophilum]|uniref:C6 zinc finger protein n=1 Tax=Colletotrichum orchidophilum TaxID=1209926 RepID=A0A1G4AQR3_9PEZI|nr:C6 zinc finger protein [Colletotrichum orchidophilum]OHE91445.1 C6 zinc finger protein [Colletotrichum orchidophilum]
MSLQRAICFPMCFNLNFNVASDYQQIQRAAPVERSAANVTARALSAIDATGDEQDPEENQQRAEPDVLPTNEFTPAQNQPSPAPTQTSQSSDHPSQGRRLLQTLPQDASPASSQDRSLGAPSPATIIGYPVDDLLLTGNSQKLLVYFDSELSPHLTIVIDGLDNPFRVHILPLAYYHTGVLNAVLGLTSCHLHLSPSGANQVDMATALQHRVAALNGLSSLLIKEEIYGLTEAEDEAVLAIIFLLVLHDAGRPERL